MNVDKESFASLMGLKEQLKVKQEEEARIAAEKEQKRKEAEAKAHEFENAMKELGVKKKIGREDKVFHAMPKPAPIPRQRYADEKAVLEDSLSDNISIDHLLDSDERLSYHLGQKVHDVLRTTVKFGMSFLTAETFDLGHGHTLNTNFCECLSHFVKFEGLDNSDDLFHFFSRNFFRNFTLKVCIY